jgi:hypothetical protein
MNLSVKRIALLFSFASAILSTACDETREIGLPQGQPLGVFVTENIPLTTSTVLVDSVPTSGSYYLLAGQYQHPKLGAITAKSFFLPVYSTNEPPDFGAGATVDSLVLSLVYEDATGNTAVDQQVNVHLLTDSIQRRPYFRYESLPYNPQAVGSATFKLLLDSANAARRTVRIRLPQSLGERLLSYSGQPFTDFIRNFYGFALVGTGNNAVVSYPADNAELMLYYTSGGTARSYLYGAFRNAIFTPGRQSNYTYGNTYLFNQIQADPANPLGLTKQYEALPSTAENPETYVQGGLGLMTRIRFDNFDEITRQGNVAVNRAELVVSPAPGSAPTADRLMLYDVTGTGQILRSEIAYWPLFSRKDLINSLPIANYANGKYIFNVTTYIQELLLNKASNNSLFISLPSVVTDVQLGAARYTQVAPNISLEESVRGAILGGHNHPTAPIKLKIYYTPIRAN